jgi:hypothetical protein
MATRGHGHGIGLTLEYLRNIIIYLIILIGWRLMAEDWWLQKKPRLAAKRNGAFVK